LGSSSLAGDIQRRGGLIDHQILGFHHVRDERLRPEAAFAKLTGTAPLVFSS
jgi:uncharacterized membrane protein